MPQNKIEDLRNHLFAQLERLGEEDITPEQLELELKRSKSMINVASVIVESAKVEVQFIEVTGEKGTGFIPKFQDKPESVIKKLG